MRAELFFLVLFVIYCLEAGLFLVLAPWNGGWDRLAFQMPLDALRGLLLTPGFRGAVTGFGLVHLVWGLHDLHALFTGRRRQRARLRAVAPAGEPAAETDTELRRTVPVGAPPAIETAVETAAGTGLRDAG